jgi:hypothetical protein
LAIPSGKIHTPANFLEIVARKIESTADSGAYCRLLHAEFRAADHWGRSVLLRAAFRTARFQSEV